MGIRALNLALRLLLELGALGALAWWGFTLPQPAPVRLVAGIGAPLFMAALWGAFVGPKAGTRLDDPARLLLELALFAAATAALAAAGHHRWAWTLGTAVVVSEGLMLALRQRGV